MFSYKPLFKLLLERDITRTQLRESLGFGTMQLAKMSKGENVSLEILDRICNYLHCNIEDIIEHIPDPKLDNEKID